MAVQGDVTDAGEVERTVAHVTERLGAIDALMLASDAARFVTGAHAQVDGGLQQR